MIKYIKGNLFTAPQDILAHGCNCVGGFGSGVAGQMSVEFPETREKYLEKFEKQGWELGDVQLVKSKDKIIANCATQKKYYPRTVRNADYPAIELCMLKLYKLCKETGKTLAMPKIGAGLAGGDWKIIEAIINDVFEDMDVYVYYL